MAVMQQRLAALALVAALGANPARALTQDEIAHLSGPDRTSILVEGARKEGKVTIYSSLIVQHVLRPIAEAFQKKYPFIKTDYWRGESEKIVQKVVAERAAHALIADVMEGSGIAALLVEANAAQSFHSPEAEATPPQYRDPRGFWAATRISFMGSAYSTREFKPGEQPKTFEALLDPRLRGRIAWRINSDSGGALLFITNLRTAWGEEKADAYFRKLSEQKMINFTASARTLVDRVIAREYAVALDIYMQHAVISAEQGAPVASQPMPIVPSTTGTVMFPAGAPHPYAGMLLIDFILSPEGQQVLVDSYEIPPNSHVKPKESLLKHVPKLIGAQENFQSPEALAQNLKASTAVFDKYFR
jgi:iron(III) transport system substrate-binding protein